jgi:hypothetical protein
MGRCIYKDDGTLCGQATVALSQYCEANQPSFGSESTTEKKWRRLDEDGRQDDAGDDRSRDEER